MEREDQGQSTTEAAGIDFLDVMFTAAMSIGVTPELLQLTTADEGHKITGILLEPWTRFSGQIPSTDEFFRILTLVLGMMTLTLSWYGYHWALSRRPHKYENWRDMVCFIVDVWLILLYAVMMIRFKNFPVVITTLLIVFVLYLVWDSLKISQFKRLNWANYPEERVTLIWTIVIFFAWTLNYAWGFEWLSLLLALFAVIAYRFHRYHAVVSDSPPVPEVTAIIPIASD